jgi:photosystem II stability/assembly factor-like uncharacterized protein
VIGTPLMGTAGAIAIGQNGETTIFTGTGVGLYRSKRLEQAGPGPEGTLPEWERLPNAPLGMMCLALSPNYPLDHMILAGTNSGIATSRDAGDTWQAAQLPISGTMVLALCFSPQFASDSSILAGTMEDGILASDTRGERWSNKSFGMLDATVYSLAISPAYARDGMAFAGTETSLYYTYNSARAWKPLPFPEQAAPVLSLGISPDFINDGVLFAGTEQGGLYRSDDRGQSWQKTALPASSVNALLVPQKNTILAATDLGVYQSGDGGDSWQRLLDLPNALTLGMQKELLLAGLAEQGVWVRSGQGGWTPLSNLPTRSFLGLLLSDDFERGGPAFMFGPQEGIWRTKDGGQTWQDRSEALPGPEIFSLAAGENGVLAAASAEGVLLSQDEGDTWQVLSEGPSNVVTFSPNGKILAAGFPGRGIRSLEILSKTWKDVPGPWDAGGQVLGLSAGNLGHFTVAILEGIGEKASLWQGKPGAMKKVLSQPVTGNPMVAFWNPPGPAADRPWFASLGNQVWKLSARSGEISARALVFPQAQRENILSLSGTHIPGGLLLLACTGRRLYQSKDGQAWTQAHDFGNERAVSITISPSYASNKAVYALLLGGTLCKGTL